ncbi:MAG: hypothetical protein C4617_04155 [Candidatus Liberibacter europaeus]|uniref:Uncharacterized protein n=1 Tax=Candidatus Liberibacter europaeus TaxID=744859 RepID=A0A2T4VXA1_9HYPH|nr:hypothetical protein [Candidatus Liberibacter europaeus]PTL86397.1 MAG: hypothetical protein C4617_04155 [Candidatus Liberibacter europaeus]
MEFWLKYKNTKEDVMSKALIRSVIILSLFLNGGLSVWSNKKNTEMSSEKVKTKNQEVSIKEAKNKLQEAEKLLKEVQDHKKLYLSLDGLADADGKVQRAIISINLIPSDIVTSSAYISAEKNRLSMEAIDLNIEMVGYLKEELGRGYQQLVDRTTKLETCLRSSIRSLEVLLSRYPSPYLSQLRDQLNINMKEIQQVGNSEVESLLSKIKTQLKDVISYLEKALKKRELGYYDVAWDWKFESAIVLYGIELNLNTLASSLVNTKGNTSAIWVRWKKLSHDHLKLVRAYNLELRNSEREEREWLATSPLSLDQKTNIVWKLIKEARKTIRKAKEANSTGNTDRALYFYDLAKYPLECASWYVTPEYVRIDLDSMKEESLNTLSNEVAAAISKILNSKHERNKSSLIAFKNHMHSIEVTLNEAKALYEQSEKILRFYI